MKLSCALLPAPNAGALAARAEALGYARAWFPDSPALYGDVWISLADAARATTRIGLGTSVIIPTLRHPAVTAAAIAHLEAIAPGRLAVAFGTGFTGRRMFGQKPMPLATLARTLRQIQALLRGDAIEIDGALAKMMHPAGVVAARPVTTPLLLAARIASCANAAAKASAHVESTITSARSPRFTAAFPPRAPRRASGACCRRAGARSRNPRPAITRWPCPRGHPLRNK